MVVQSRLDFVRRMIAAGRRTRITFGASSGGMTKIKITIESDPSSTTAHTRLMAGTLLDAAAHMVNISVAVDRGHKHSSGQSEICIWLKAQVATPAPSSLVPSGAAIAVQAVYCAGAVENVDVEMPLHSTKSSLHPRPNTTMVEATSVTTSSVSQVVERDISDPTHNEESVAAAPASSCVSAAAVSPFATAEDDPHALDDSAWLNVHAPQPAETSCTSAPLGPGLLTATQVPSPTIVSAALLPQVAATVHVRILPMMSNEAKAAPCAVTLAVKDDQDNETFFQINRTISMKELMNAYCVRLGLWPQEICFSVYGEEVLPSDTADVPGLEGNDIIDVFGAQRAAWAKRPLYACDAG